MKASRGFSLLELLTALGIVAILLGVLLANFRTGARRAEPGALANVVAAEIQAARNRAMADQTYVALEFPSSASGCCQSMTRWEGTSQAHWRKGFQFGRDFPNCGLFVGSWPVTAGAFSIDRPPTGLEIPGFDLSRWWAPAPLPSDSLLVFCPTGCVLSNDLPLLDGHYEVVVGSSLQASGTAHPPGTPTVSPGPAYFNLQQVVDPYRIEIDTMGTVQVRPGMGSATGVVLSPSGPGTVPAPAALAPAVSAPTPPVVQSISLSPTMPSTPGLEGSVSKDDYLRLTVEASDASGLPLTCQWTSDNGGAFTAATPEAMRWDAQKQRWICSWTFRADPNDTPGKVYSLNCLVKDSQGNLATAAAGVTLNQRIQVRIPPFCVSTCWPMDGVYLCNTDGTDLRHLTVQGQPVYFATAHPDGSTIMVATYRNGGMCQLMALNRDGSGLRPLTNPTTNVIAGSYSADGSKIAYSAGFGIHIMPACGEVNPPASALAQLPPRALTLPANVRAAWWPPRFNQAGTKICFTAYVGPAFNTFAVFVYDLSANTCLQVTPAIPGVVNDIDYTCSYSRDPAYPKVIVGRAHTAPYVNTNYIHETYLVNDDDPSSYRVIPPPMGWTGIADCPSFGRDGTSLLLQTGAGVGRCDIDLATGTTSNFKLIGRFGGGGASLDQW